MATRDNTKNLQVNKPGLFTPTISRGIKQGPVARSVSFGRSSNELVESNISSSGSFKYDVVGTGLKNTQQLTVDYSKFENHTFFNSAQVKSNIAFDIIQNGFPFDGTKQEFENFFEGLTGFEKWVYDRFPKDRGYMYFSGSSAPNDGTYITVVDRAGSAFPTLSKLASGQSILNPGANSMTIEMQLFLPPEANSDAAILDKHVTSTSAEDGFYLALHGTADVATGSVSFYVLSGSVYDQVTVNLLKDQWNHLAFVWNRTPGVEIISAYVNQELLASSSQPVEFGNIDSKTADLYIGSGSALIQPAFDPTTTFSGAMDELRIWHKIVTNNNRKLFKEKNIFAQDGLQAYYKLNEPSGSNSNVILDHSGNSLHGILNFNAVNSGILNVATGAVAGPSPMIYEKTADNPILFPSHPDVLDLQTELLLSASSFDQANPNIITRLIPPHYLIEGQAEEGFETETGEITEQIQSGNDPRSFSIGATQTLLLLLYTWAKFFDELKLYVQAFGTLRNLDYDQEDTVPDQFLLEFARNEGIDLPPLFEGSSIEQFLEGENILSNISNNDTTLQSVRNQIWRRILINLQDVLRSKGTIHSVKAFIRSVGIDPDNNFRIREYGGPTSRPLTFVREQKSEISTLADFISGSAQTFISPFLTATRVEPGYPQTTDGTSDTYLTSGSWTYEGHYKFVPGSNITPSQSLVRFFVSSSDYGTSTVANLVHVKGGYTTLYVSANPASPTILTMPITGADLFDGQSWYVSFGRQRADEISSTVSASYFLRLAKNEFGTIGTQYTTQSYFDETFAGSAEEIVWSSTGSFISASNTSGPAFIIGSGALDVGGLDAYLNSGSNTNPTSKVTDFYGRVGHIRFWSKALTDDEWPEHVRYFRSVGVLDPKTNFNFSVTPTGSWERLRVDASTDQPITASDSSGTIYITDFTQNGFTLTGSGFFPLSGVIVPERFFFSYLSPKFDEAATIEKVRVRGFQEFENVQNTPWAQVSPVYDIERSELPTDNTRFTIDFSVVDALNQDIVTIFGTLRSLDNVLGDPELLYSPDYPGLEDLRQIYFNKLTEKMNLRLFFDFFKWFDTNIGTFVSQLLPRKTRFLGTNFVVESHMLERPRVEYQFSDIYLGDNLRHSLKDTILLRLITGEFKKY